MEKYGWIGDMNGLLLFCQPQLYPTDTEYSRHQLFRKWFMRVVVNITLTTEVIIFLWKVL